MSKNGLSLQNKSTRHLKLQINRENNADKGRTYTI